MSKKRLFRVCSFIFICMLYKSELKYEPCFLFSSSGLVAFCCADYEEHNDVCIRKDTFFFIVFIKITRVDKYYNLKVQWLPDMICKIDSSVFNTLDLHNNVPYPHFCLNSSMEKFC